MKKKSQRLQPVVKVAEGREQQAAKALGEAQTALNAAQQQLTELETYRDEYVQRFQQAGALGMGAARLEDYRHFLHKLGQAIEQQTQAVVQAEKLVAKRREHWFTHRGKVRMLDTVVSRYQAVEQRQEARKEQGEQDERNQAASHAARSNDS